MECPSVPEHGLVRQGQVETKTSTVSYHIGASHLLHQLVWNVADSFHFGLINFLVVTQCIY